MSKTIISNEQGGKFQTICKKCDCHFRFGSIDTYKHTNQDRDGSSVDTYVDCPNCSNPIYADGIVKPSSGTGFMGFFAPVQIEQKILNMDVSKLRSTTSDDEFRRLLLNQLSL